MAYLALPDNTPDIESCMSCCNSRDTPTGKDQLPIKLVGVFVHQKIPENERAMTSKNYSILFNQFINKNPEWLNREITNAYDLKTLLGLYDPIREAISFASAVSFSPEVIVQFTDKFNGIGRPEVAIRVYNDFKPVFKEDKVAMGLLNGHLLETVSRLPATTREYRLKSVQGCWKPCLKVLNQSQKRRTPRYSRVCRYVRIAGSCKSSGKQKFQTRLGLNDVLRRHTLRLCFVQAGRSQSKKSNSSFPTRSGPLIYSMRFCETLLDRKNSISNCSRRTTQIFCEYSPDRW